MVRTLIATRTKKRACEILNISLHDFNNYWAPTGNDDEIKIALSKPEVVFWASSSAFGAEFKEKR